MGVKPRFIRAPWWLLNAVLQKLAEFAFGICIPESAVVGRRVRFEHFGPIVIHGNARIGDGCLLRQGVTIGNKGDADPAGAPVLGCNVEVGAGAVLVGRIVVGDGAVIGANAVVTKDVPPYAVMVGVPAREVARRASATGPER
jgi:serine O-acetyltransferase